MSKDFASFGSLPESLQVEALREGEKLLDAQLATAIAADQRALTWSGFLITAATGALGGGTALIIGKNPEPIIGLMAFAFAGALLSAAWLAVRTVRPSKFGFPGNQPAYWLPHEWDCRGTSARKEQQARIDQARALDACICDNREAAEKNAKSMSRSIAVTLWAIIVGTIAMVVVVVGRLIDIPWALSFLIQA